MGTPDFAIPSLEILLSSGYDVPAVVTAPDKPRGRGQQVSATPVKTAALRHGLIILQPESLREPSFAGDIARLRPDLIVVVAFRILPKEIFLIPALGSFNLHASLLPKYRGAAPIHWAIINGETETGVTTFFLEEKVDTGSTLVQRRMAIGLEDDAGSVHDRLAHVGAEAVLETVRLIAEGKAQPVPQDHAHASNAPRIFREDCRIDWQQSARHLHDRIRGLSPTPTAFTGHKEKIIKLFRTRILDIPSSKDCGAIEATQSSLSVHTGDLLLSILEIQQEGKKRLKIEEFLRGSPLATGEKFQ